MKLSSVVTLAIALATAGGQARPASSIQPWLQDDLDAVTLYPIQPERIAHSTPRLLPGYQKYLRQKQTQRTEHFKSQLAAKQQFASVGYFIQDDTSQLTGDADTHRADQLLFQSQANDKHDITQPAYLTQRLDHFDNTTSATFQQRFFYSLRNYIPSSKRNGQPVPIYILDSGEAKVEDRLPYLDHGILEILSKETGGIGIVLEHRYYGTSVPNRTELGPGTSWSTDQLRWLTNKQALEDSAEFIRKLNIPGIDNKEPRKVIYYSGSYPGGRAAHMRVLYPDIVHGAIASSAVVNAIDEYPEYFYPIARGAPAGCSQAIQAAIADIDRIIAPDPELGSHQTRRNRRASQQLFDLFGLKGLSQATDFANTVTLPLNAFQSQRWSGPNQFVNFCNNLATYGIGGKYPPQSKSAQLEAQGLQVSREVHAYADYVRNKIVYPCIYNITDPKIIVTSATVQYLYPVYTPDQCFAASPIVQNFNTSDNLSWSFQTCTEFGYNMVAPLISKQTVDPSTGVKSYTYTGPKMISSLLDYSYVHDEMCSSLFPPGNSYSVPSRLNVDAVNKYGGFNIGYDRLGFIDGQYDPWRPATVHSEEFAYGGARPDTLTRPFKLIPDCWHVCDLPTNATEPPRIQTIHHAEIDMVQAWLKEKY